MEALPAEIVALLKVLLRPEDAFEAALLAQVPFVTGWRRCTCGCPSLDFDVAAEAVPAQADSPRSPAVADGYFTAEGSDRFIGSLTVFEWRGRLSSLELFDLSGPDQPAVGWPSPESVIRARD